MIFPTSEGTPPSEAVLWLNHEEDADGAAGVQVDHLIDGQVSFGS